MKEYANSIGQTCYKFQPTTLELIILDGFFSIVSTDLTLSRY